ncbi:MAG TPA: CotH kinase family protein, partial [Candidatus Limnocylindria bacterium]|nr:CotH kinase family protein [Candidatus Limnocylindria bacterium]
MLPNEFGQNWGSSTQSNGTPGIANTMSNTNIPPMVLSVTHFPVVPASTDTVSITTRIRDEQVSGTTVTLFYRNHSTTTPPAFSSVTMFDDGAHSDGLVGDGVFGVTLPAQANGTVIEYYVRAVDSLLNTNTWPGAARQTDGSFAQTANALYQVSDEIYAGTQPIYRLIMTESERVEFTGINRQSDAEMNCTFISIDGEGVKVRQNCGMRIRGAGSRGANPPNLRVNIASDRRWNSVTEINLNTRYTHAQTIGSALSLKAGLPAAYARPVKVRINGTDMANSGSPMFGSYAFVEPINAEWAAEHFPNDDNGNVYRGSRAPWTANLDYRGTSPAVYEANGYSKTSNQSENDWTDLFNLTFALNTNATDAVYEQAVQAQANVTNFMRFFALGSLMSYQETSLFRGVGDDYAMYRGVVDTRFTLVPHDFDTVLNQGDTGGSVTESIFQPILNPESANANERANFLQRMMRNPRFVPIFFSELKRLGETVFAPTNLNPLVDQLLGDWASGTVNGIKTFNANRNANVLSQIPLTYSLAHTLGSSNGVLRTTAASISLRGAANAIDTRNVRINGVAGAYSGWEGRWTNSAVALQPGLNNLLVEAVGASGEVVWNTNLAVWYDTSAFTSVSGNISANTVWSAGSGPYRVTANVTVASGATLTIQPGTTVYLNSGVGISVANGGRLLAEGNPNARIQFNAVPGPLNRWSGIVINGSGASVESRIAYAHLEGNNGTAIDVSGGAAFLDHLTFGTTDRRYMDLDAASFIVSHCVFPTTTAVIEPVHGAGGIRSGGRGIFLRNFFGRVNGYSDTVDFTGGNRPGPIVQFIQNVFMGSDDDILDLDSTDAWVEGNIFLHTHRLGSPDSASAVSGGNDDGQASEITMVGNLFFDVDHAATAKQGNFYTFVNNTVVRQSSAGFEDAGAGAVLNFADEGTVAASGIYSEGNIIFDAERLTRHLTNGSPLAANTTFHNNLMPFAYAGPGTNNSSANPLLKRIPTLAETMAFTSWEQAQVLRDWFSLQGGSPGLATGPNGRDKGGVVPLGVSISGEPAGTSPLDAATLWVGANRTGNGIPAAGFPNGSGYTHYKWRLDEGSWSAETPASTSIVLNNLGLGAHRVDVVGKRDANFYQDDSVYGPAALITESRTWFVNTNTSAVRINEILASNGGIFVHSNTTPDALELVNLSAVPVNLEGLRLTDDPADPDKFVFGPGSTIPAGGYLVVFADDGN